MSDNREAFKAAFRAYRFTGTILEADAKHFWQAALAHAAQKDNRTTDSGLIDRLAFCLYHQPHHGMPYDDCKKCATHLADAALAHSAKALAEKDEEIERLKRVVDAAVTMLSKVEGQQIAIWSSGAYVTWNDGEYWISKATKELKNLIKE